MATIVQMIVTMIINNIIEGIIRSFDYSTYQSTGRLYGALFSHPQCISDKHSEIISVLLNIIDKYAIREFRKLDK